MKNVFSLFLILSLSIASLAQATVTIQVSQIGVARATGFANNAGVATDGMRWGIVVSTGNAGFSGGSYDLFDVNTSGFLTVGGLPTDDYYVAHPTSAVTATLGATGGDPGGVGGMTSINPVPFGGATNISSGDPFALIWFDGTPASGSFYGMLSNTSTAPNFTIPNDTDVYSVASFFAGGTADAPKAANLQFGGAAVPEPSRLILLGLGFAGLIWRRKR